MENPPRIPLVVGRQHKTGRTRGALSYRERLIILFCTAPEGFNATWSELERKFNAVGKSSVQTALTKMVARGELAHDRQLHLYSIGPTLLKELGGCE